jgi:hypothetical protein
MRVTALYFAIGLLCFVSLTTGCYTARTTVALNPGKVPVSGGRREGTIGVKFEDTRADRTNVGKMSGRIGLNAIFEVNGKQEDRYV